MEKIRVKAWRENEEETESKIDALLAEYKVAHKLADEVVQKNQEMINALGKAKWAEICKQINESIKKANKVYETLYRGEDKLFCGCARGVNANYNISIRYDSHGKARVTLGQQKFISSYSSDCNLVKSAPFCEIAETDLMSGWLEECGLVTKWNELNLLGAFEKDLYREIEHKIKKAKEHIKDSDNNLKAMEHDNEV